MKGYAPSYHSFVIQLTSVLQTSHLFQKPVKFLHAACADRSGKIKEAREMAAPRYRHIQFFFRPYLLYGGREANTNCLPCRYLKSVLTGIFPVSWTVRTKRVVRFCPSRFCLRYWKILDPPLVDHNIIIAKLGIRINMPNPAKLLLVAGLSMSRMENS